jgi:exodeoxyribonuclease VII large subunit
MLRTQLARCCESVDVLVDRARRATALATTRRGERLEAATARLRASLRANAESHRSRIEHARERVAALEQRGSRAMITLLCQRVASLDRCAGLLQALSHRGVLARGFALVRDGKRRPVPHAARVNAGMSLDIEFFDGHVRASAEHAFVTPPEKPRPRLRSRRLADPGQGKLFD